MLNFMGYDAANMGNHDVETGRAVFDRWAGDCRAPVLNCQHHRYRYGRTPLPALQGAGARRSEDCRPRHDNARHSGVALRESVRGLRFDDMEETARKWMKIIRERASRYCNRYVPLPGRTPC